MKDYNGFSSSQRNRAQSWLNTQWSKGLLVKPTKCVACGQEHGVIDAHAEDYSEPFRAGVTDGFHLCFACHMMVHCRHRNQGRWLEYREIIESGLRSLPFFRRDWPRFERDFLRGSLHQGLFEASTVPERLTLYEIQLSQDAAHHRTSYRPVVELPENEIAQRPRSLNLTIMRR